MSIYLSQGLTIYLCVVAGVFGAVMGSFLNCTAWRVAHGEKFWKGRSHCPSCGHTLGARDLVPVFSWLFLKGKCRYCGEHVPVRYLLVELFFAAVTVLCLLRFDLTVLCLRNYILLCCLFVLSLVDLETFTIPNVCLIIPAAAWAVSIPLVGQSWPDIRGSLIAAVAFGGGMLCISLVMDKLLGRDSLGGGDIKLLAVVGLYLGLIGSMFSLLLSCVLGLLLVLIRRRFSEPRQEQASPGQGAIPFGPAISLAAAAMLLYGGALTEWYMGLF